MVVESALVGGDVKVNGNRLLEVEALELAQMHGNFGHKFVAVAKKLIFVHVLHVGKKASLHCKNQFEWPIKRTPLSFWSMLWYIPCIITCYQPRCFLGMVAQFAAHGNR